MSSPIAQQSTSSSSSSSSSSSRFRDAELLVDSRFRFPTEESVLQSDGGSGFGGILTPLIRPLRNSSTPYSEHEAGTTNCENFTFGAIVEVQARKLFPTRSAYLCCVRRELSDHHFTTGEPIERINTDNAPEANGDIPHAERPERAVHTYRQPQLFRRSCGRREPSSGPRRLISRNIDASGFRWRARMFVPHASKSYETFDIRPRARSAKVPKRSVELGGTYLRLDETSWNAIPSRDMSLYPLPHPSDGGDTVERDMHRRISETRGVSSSYLCTGLRTSGLEHR